MSKPFEVVYTKQEGFFRGHEFVIKKTTEHTHTVFAEDEKEARAIFTKETNVGDKRIKRVKESQNSNSLGSLFPSLAKLKDELTKG